MGFWGLLSNEVGKLKVYREAELLQEQKFYLPPGEFLEDKFPPPEEYSHASRQKQAALRMKYPEMFPALPKPERAQLTKEVFEDASNQSKGALKRYHP